METKYATTLLLAFLACVSNVLCQTVTLHVHPEKEVFLEGEDVSLACSVRDIGPGQFITWKKVDQDVATNDQLGGRFGRDGTRFTANYVEISDDIVNFYVNISNLMNRDAGKYSCYVSNKVPEAQEVELKITVPPKEIMLVANQAGGDEVEILGADQEIKYGENERASVVCTVKGANPEPDVQIMVGDEVIADPYVIREVKADDVAVEEDQREYADQMESTTTVILTLNEYPITYRQAGKRLTCAAGLQGHELSLTRSFAITMDGVRPILECDSEYMLGLHTSNQEIMCQIQSSPPATDGYIYYYDNDKMTPENRQEVRVGDRSKYFVELVSSQNGDRYLSLHFDRIYQYHFKKYFFVAINEIGESEPYEIIIKEDPSKSIIIDNGASSVISPISTFLCAILCWLLL